MNEKALLVVSFGTSYEETRKKTIDKIEEDLAASFPDRRLYRAWTSKMIIKKLKNRDNIIVDTVPEALERMAADGVTDLLVQPTHVLNGLENEWMREDILKVKDRFETIRIGDPLLMYTEDFFTVIRGLMASLPIPAEDEALVFMGHGTSHSTNMTYPALDYMFKDRGFPHVLIGTVEGYPELDSVLRDLKEMKTVRKVYLAPFMVVAGDHALNDMAGDDEDSWKSQLTEAGYEVECILKGLGEFDALRKLFSEHAEKAELLD